MPAYADYTFYTGTYRGTAIDEGQFDHLATIASAHIDGHTFGRAGAIVEAGTETVTIEAIARATCAAAEELLRQQSGGVIQSERVGQHSVTYLTGPARSDSSRIKAAIKPYLWATGLMYAGLDSE